MLDIITVKMLDEFTDWLDNQKDKVAKLRILKRIKQLRNGYFGDFKSVGYGISELKIDYGPGYRVYYTRKGQTIVILLCGGDKSTQKSDIEKAKTLLKEVNYE